MTLGNTDGNQVSSIELGSTSPSSELGSSSVLFPGVSATAPESPSSAAQDSHPELGSTSIIELGSSTVLSYAAQVSPSAAQVSASETVLELGSFAFTSELSPSASAEETSYCTYRDIRVILAPVPDALNGRHHRT